MPFFGLLPFHFQSCRVGCVNDIGIANVMAVSLSELWSCVKVEVAILGSQSLIVLMVGVDGRKAALEEEAHLNAGIIWVVTV